MMMYLGKGISVLVLGFMICIGAGCDSGGGDNNEVKVQSYAGEWAVMACTQGLLTMDFSQEGSTLTVIYTVPDSDITDVFSGTVDGNGVADLMGDEGRMIAITFNSTNSFSGDFFVEGVKVCDISGRK